MRAVVVEPGEWHLDHPPTDDDAMQESAVGTKGEFAAVRKIVRLLG